MKYCPFCGAGLQEEMNFCPDCGKAYQSAIQLKDESGDAVVSALTENKRTVSKSFERRKIPIRYFGKVVVAATTIVVVLIAVIFHLRKDFSKDAKAIEKKSQSVVMLYCYDPFGELRATGSGFVAYDDSTIVTNYHVIDRAADIKVSTEEDFTIDIESVIAFDVDKDIAILKAEKSTGLKPLPLGKSTKEKKGSAVVAIGSPLGNKNTVSTGVVSGRIYDASSGLDMLQFTAPISSGSSGGALLNNKGRVIGITAAAFTEGQNLNLAVPAEVVDELFEEKSDPIAVRQVFKRVYGEGAHNCYMNGEFVDFRELQKNPLNFSNTPLTTEAFLVREESANGTTFYRVYADERSAALDKEFLRFELKKGTGPNVGYARISGVFQADYAHGEVPSSKLYEFICNRHMMTEAEFKSYAASLGIEIYLVTGMEIAYCEVFE